MDKPWTVGRGPIPATETDLQKAEAINALLVCPIGILPTASGDPIRPFAIGLFDEIRTLLKPDVAATKLRRAVGAFVHSKRYYFASAQPDSMRHDIDGKPIEPLSSADRLAAQQSFLSLKRDRDQPAASAPEPVSPSTPPSKTEQIRTALLSRSRSSQRAAAS
jgi:sRNA-binding protein